MHVVLLVTRQAVLLELHLIRWAAVARLAGELAVRAAERKSGLLAVGELPQVPAVLRMAALAVLAEIALVHVILLVAVDAFVADLAILAGEVTLLTRHRHVQTDQREFRQVVIEAHARAPALRRVALIALLAEAAGVHIVRPMAAHALGRLPHLPHGERDDAEAADRVRELPSAERCARRQPRQGVRSVPHDAGLARERELRSRPDEIPAGRSARDSAVRAMSPHPPVSRGRPRVHRLPQEG